LTAIKTLLQTYSFSSVLYKSNKAETVLFTTPSLPLFVGKLLWKIFLKHYCFSQYSTKSIIEATLK
jgi:hypothetical protein